MFTVPSKYQDNNSLDFMLKELSFLFCKLNYYYQNNAGAINIKVNNFEILVEKRKLHKWVIGYDVQLKPENFSMTFKSTTDGLVFKECKSSIEGIECTEEDIVNLVKKTNLLEILRNKIETAKQSFVKI